MEAETGEEALEKLSANPDTRVVLLDIMLPGIDGIEVCRRIRLTDPHIGIVMLSARSQEMDKVTGLMTGADDYMTKPFSPAELTARVDALLRRMGDAPAASVPQSSSNRMQTILFFMIDSSRNIICLHYIIFSAIGNRERGFPQKAL